ncbi:HAD-like protein [Neocallimastix lanati (nom. inval.)]|jgi:Dullard-like phosphatase family protein|uniref:Mitochondrial import inner membrane translocase subunit TIM50 n=1 Tax=Neocallimastix californiae TaxID=1754190 RepID=A0A1Y2ETT1_9FUNG|nr:HAD-like protein [Neocallimastix sp. JGI-2020a]ORY74958.1 HAD-like protein [Neocallimastix californiae]|eukprot:ORY74958.1 HAD-like protein [Neocallimastix californiae]
MSITSITSKIPNRLIGLPQLVPMTSRLITNSYYPNLRNINAKINVQLYSTQKDDNNKENKIPKKNVSDFDAMKLGEEKLREQKKQNEPSKPKKEKKEKKENKNNKENPEERETHFLRNIFLFTSTLGLASLLYYGRPYEKTDSLKPEAWLERSKKRIEDKKNEEKKLLPDLLPEPYGHPYTLVLNLDDTLISVEWEREQGWRIAKRPGLDFFIQYLSNFYEIIVVSTSSPVIAAPLIDKIDPYGLIMYRLYKDSLVSVKKKKVKDLNQYNRDIRKTILIDINKDGYALHPNNGITISKFTGDKNDTELLKLIPFLETMVITAPEDIRPVLKSYANKYIPKAFSDYQEELRKQFNKEHREKMAHLHLKNDPAKGLFDTLLGGRADSHEGVIGVITPEWTNPVNEIEERRVQTRYSFLTRREEWAKLIEEQRELQQKEIQAQLDKLEKRKEGLKNFVTFGLYKKFKKNDKKEEELSNENVIILEEKK